MPSNSRCDIHAPVIERTFESGTGRRDERDILYRSLVSLCLRARDIDNYFPSRVEKSVAVTLIIIQSFALATDIAELRNCINVTRVRAREV